MLKKIFWLIAGMMVGVGISSTIANTREPAAYRFKVLAVSIEDASEKASEHLRDGSLRSELNTDLVVSATVPTCEEAGSEYACETRLLYRR